MTPAPEPMDAGQRSGLYKLIAEKEALRLLVEQAVPWVAHPMGGPTEESESWLARAKVLAEGKSEP